MIHLKFSCTNKDCPAFSRCCFLPTEVFPSKEDGQVAILFVGQGGGSDERKKGRPFIGRAGKRLREIVLHVRNVYGKSFGVAFSNTIRDNPEDNRVPTKEELEVCLPFLLNDIKTLKESGLRVVIPLGNASKKAMIPEAVVGISQDHGKVYQVNNEVFGQIWMMPTYHPSYLIRNSATFNTQKLHPLDVAVIEDIQRALSFEAYRKD